VTLTQSEIDHYTKSPVLFWPLSTHLEHENQLYMPWSYLSSGSCKPKKIVPFKILKTKWKILQDYSQQIYLLHKWTPNYSNEVHKWNNTDCSVSQWTLTVKSGQVSTSHEPVMTSTWNPKSDNGHSIGMHSDYYVTWMLKPFLLSSRASRANSIIDPPTPTCDLHELILKNPQSLNSWITVVILILMLIIFLYHVYHYCRIWKEAHQ
jgi:hypothetical protein